MTAVIEDFRYALRQLRKNPGFTAVAVLTLALGMGLNTAIGSMVYGIIVRPLPYSDPARVVELAASSPEGLDEQTVTYPEFAFFCERNSLFESLAVFTPVNFNLATQLAAERVNGLHVSSSYFHLLGVKPILGRDFLPTQHTGEGAHVVLLSYRLWKERAGGDPNIVGRPIRLNGDPYTVIGVMPAHFERLANPMRHGETGVWAPMALVGSTIGSGANLAMIGRLNQTLGVQVKSGRPFTALDNETSAPVAIVSESFARQAFPKGSALGEHVVSNEDRRVREIVGVTRDLKSVLDQPVQATVFVPLEQVPAGSTEIWEVWFPTHVLVRTSRNAMALNRTIQERARALDSGITVGQIRSMEAVRSASLSGRRFNMALVSLFAALALVLAAIGIYGVIAYQVTERRHEIGIRMALGAERREILRLVMRQGLRLLAIGLTLGLMGGLALSRLFESYLFEVKALDPLAFTSAAVLLLSTGLLACAAPARGAAKVDPLVALRYE